MPKILIVDDNDDARQILVDGVRHAGYEVVQAVNGKEGLARIQQESPDVVLLDLMMPEMDGYELMESLRGNPPKGKWIPVIVVSALKKLEDLKRSFALEAEHYITKPWEMHDILNGIELMLKLKDQRKVED